MMVGSSKRFTHRLPQYSSKGLNFNLNVFDVLTQVKCEKPKFNVLHVLFGTILKIFLNLCQNIKSRQHIDWSLTPT